MEIELKKKCSFCWIVYIFRWIFSLIVPFVMGIPSNRPAEFSSDQYKSVVDVVAALMKCSCSELVFRSSKDQLHFYWIVQSFADKYCIFLDIFLELKYFGVYIYHKKNLVPYFLKFRYYFLSFCLILFEKIIYILFVIENSFHL